MNKHELKSLLENIYTALTEEAAAPKLTIQQILDLSTGGVRLGTASDIVPPPPPPKPNRPITYTLDQLIRSITTLGRMLQTEEGEWHPPLLSPTDPNAIPMAPPPPWLSPLSPTGPIAPPVTPTITPYDPVVLDPSSIPTLLRELNFPITIPPELTNEGLEEWLKGLNWWQMTQIWGWYTLHIAPTLTPEQLEFVEKWKQAHGM